MKLYYESRDSRKLAREFPMREFMRLMAEP